ncbi:36.4 kDa proline-rich protein-like [Hyposmocoma kahamanoa]|uniref:36.4 kDa proline-rich protein-like n=1 Tax=Hyposmocoma kahamanoa TaxID=1477025 RepID=UPI000E6D5DD3|nr:36.4 kDa proline-rich protein-like [Hyposmocoma kahamanoa]
MKFFAAFALIVAVASAGVIKPTSSEEAQIQAIIDAIQSPSTDPATAILLQQQLAQLLGIAPPSPIIVDIADPVVVVDDAAVAPIVVVDDIVSPVEVVEEAVVAPIVVVDEAAPAPVAPVVNPTPASSPLVQVILNINAPAGAVDVGSAINDITADPVNVVDETIYEEINPAPVIVPPVVLPAPDVEPIIVVEPIFPAPVPPVEPIIIGEPTLPVVVPPVINPVIIGEPTLPVAPAVTLPETLN